jgi:asparagine synthase (glutamine-hydrolysing)
VARSFETLRRAADLAGVELRFPFYDRRLVSYALAIPDSEKLKNGWSRSVLRNAMTGILPEKVRRRRHKIDFGAELSQSLVRNHRDVLDALIRPGSLVEQYVDASGVRARVESLLAAPGQPRGDTFGVVWRVAFLARWLEARRAAAPSRDRARTLA